MKKSIVIAAASAALVVAAVLFLLLQDRIKEPEYAGSIDAYFHLYNSPADSALAALMDEFESEYPEVDVHLVIEPYSDLKKSLQRRLLTLQEDEASSIVLSVLSGADLDMPADYGASPDASKSFAPWISNRWGLYYNEKRLSEAGYTEEELESLSSEGFESFVEALASAPEEGETLFFTGGKPVWPWLAWIQHLQLEATKGSMPKGFSPSDYREGLDAWSSLAEGGHMNSGFEEALLAESHFSISREKALFVLSDATILNTYRARERVHIQSIPFPGSVTQGWQVGGDFYLGLIYSEGASASTRAAGRGLIEYLRSLDIRERFLKTTGIRLLQEEAFGALEVIPSITPKVREPELQELISLKSQIP